VGWIEVWDGSVHMRVALKKIYSEPNLRQPKLLLSTDRNKTVT